MSIVMSTKKGVLDQRPVVQTLYHSDENSILTSLFNIIISYAESAKKCPSGTDPNFFKSQSLMLIGGTAAGGSGGANVYSRNMIMLDFDSGVSIDMLHGFCTQENYEAIIYTSFSHSEGDPRIRLALPLGRTLLADTSKELYFKACWYIYDKLKTYLGLDTALGLDTCSFEWSRWMFLPDRYLHQKPVVHYIAGSALFSDPDIDDKLENIKWQNLQRATKKRTPDHGATPEITDTAYKNYSPAIRNANHGLSTRPLQSNDYIRLESHRNKSSSGSYAYVDSPSLHLGKSVRQFPYAITDFQRAEDYKPLDHEKSFQEILKWERSSPSIALLSENTGSGKSQHFIALGKRDDDQRRIFTAPNKQSRDDIYNAINEPDRTKLIYGNKDLILNYIETLNGFHSEYRLNEISSTLAVLYEVAEADGVILTLKSALKKLSLSAQESNAILQANEAQNALVDNRSYNLVMTTQKFDAYLRYQREIFKGNGQDYDLFEDCIVYVDEYQNSSLTRIINPENRDEIREANLIDRKRRMKICYASAEMLSVHELKAQVGINLSILGAGIQKMAEPNLAILYVDSTAAGNPEADGYVFEDTHRYKVYEKAEKVFGARNIICNGLKNRPSIINKPHNTVKTKGDNSFIDGTTLCTIGTFPPVAQLETIIRDVKLDGDDARWEATEMWASSEYSQALGRNMGYRNKDDRNWHLLIVPKSMPLDIDFVTTNVFRDSDWAQNVEARRNCPPELTKLIDGYLQVSEEDCDEIRIEKAINETLLANDNDGVKPIDIADLAKVSSQAVGKYVKKSGELEINKRKYGTRSAHKRIFYNDNDYPKFVNANS